MESSPVRPDTLDTLLQRAREARDASSLESGRDLAAQAWARARELGDRAAQAQAGHLLCFFQFRLGALAALLASGDQTLPLLDAAAARIELLRWMTLAGCEIGRFDRALEHANAVSALAEQTDDPRARASALSVLAACFERMGDPWQAERLMGEALTIVREHGSVFDRMVTLNNLSAVLIGAFYLLRGGDADPQEAREALQRAGAHAAEALPLAIELGDPVYRVFVEGNLGEVLLHLGELDEAAQRLQRSLREALQGGYDAQAWRIRCSMGELLIEQGRLAEAKAALETLLHDMRDADVRATLVRLRHALYRACRELGLAGEALVHLEQHQLLERRRATAQLKAQSQHFVTRVEAEQSRLQAERARLEAQQQRLRAAEFEAHALRDPLTGLPNRRLFEQALPAVLAEAQARAAPLALALLDLDHFKHVNDRFGHGVGDRVLIALAQMLRENTRASDVLARIGGEEFLVVLPDTEPERAREVCERLCQRVAAHPWDGVAPGLGATLSIGLAHAPGYALDELFERADAALYRAKQRGRNRVEAG